MYRKPPTIQDVARFAKVSTATVSRALTAPERVSKLTRDRVENAVRETGYTVNQAGRNLRKRTSRTILVALPNIGNPFFSAILDAIERTATEAGFSTLIANRAAGEAPHERLAEHLQSHRADGVLVLDGGVDLDRIIAQFPRGVMPPVVIACETIAGSGLPTVKTDNAGAARIAVGYLADLGHTHIGHIAGPRQNVLHGERYGGYVDELWSRGLPIRDDWLYPGDYTMSAGVRAARTFLAQTDRPSAIFSANDEMAFGFISELRRAGLTVPEDVSVMGFDDIEVSERFMPALTTMRQARTDLGRLATGALIELLASSTRAAPKSHVLKAELVVRDSTAPYMAKAARPLREADRAAKTA